MDLELCPKSAWGAIYGGKNEGEAKGKLGTFLPIRLDSPIVKKNIRSPEDDCSAFASQRRQLSTWELQDVAVVFF